MTGAVIGGLVILVVTVLVVAGAATGMGRSLWRRHVERRDEKARRTARWEHRLVTGAQDGTVVAQVARVAHTSTGREYSDVQTMTAARLSDTTAVWLAQTEARHRADFLNQLDDEGSDS